jgi:hypothetical protein
MNKDKLFQTEKAGLKIGEMILPTKKAKGACGNLGV